MVKQLYENSGKSLMIVPRKMLKELGIDFKGKVEVTLEGHQITIKKLGVV